MSATTKRVWRSRRAPFKSIRASETPAEALSRDYFAEIATAEPTSGLATNESWLAYSFDMCWPIAD